MTINMYDLFVINEDDPGGPCREAKKKDAMQERLRRYRRALRTVCGTNQAFLAALEDADAAGNNQPQSTA